MLGYQKRSDYKGIKREADKFYKELLELRISYRDANEQRKERALKTLQDFYKQSEVTKLYNEKGGLYCSILEDVARNI